MGTRNSSGTITAVEKVARTHGEGDRSGTMSAPGRYVFQDDKEAHLSETNGPTILVVEDEALIRMISADILTEAGFHVLEAQNADEAIAIMEAADHVELVFTDIRMPGRMDGLELAAFVHAHWPDVRLLVTSGHVVLSSKEIPDGGRFVSKPYELTRLVSEVRAIVALPAKR